MPKINEVMPVDIARYVADTIFLDSEMDCAYMHALLYQWGNGPLPNDLAQCARLMKLSGGEAHEKAAWLLRRFFVQAEDGRWINLRSEAIKSAALVRESRIVDRNRKANETRWAGHTRKWPQRNPARILQGQDGANSGVLLDYKKDFHKESQLHSSSIPISDAKGHPQALPVVLELGKNTSPQLRFGGEAAAPPVRPPEKKFRARSQKANTRQTPAKSPSDAPKKPGMGKGATRAPATKPAPDSASKRAGKNGGSNPPKRVSTPDPRFRTFRREFFEFWKNANPDAVAYPWGPRDGAALNRLLRPNKAMALEQFRACMVHRLKSERVNPARPAHEWLDDLLRYAAGPLNRFGELR